jgi:hypothetical protein
MSGGQRINDHSFWAGGKSKGSVFPEGAKIQHHSDDGHDGHLSKYEDTDVAIRSQQEMNKKKAKGHDMKPGYRY